MKKWFENIKIAQKLRIGFLSVTFLAILIGLIGIVNLFNTIKDQQEAYNQCTLGIEYATKAETCVLKIRTAIRDLYIYYDTDKEEYYEEIIGQLSKLEENLKNYSSTIANSEDQKNYDSVKSAYELYKKDVNTILDAEKSGKSSSELLSVIKGLKGNAGDTLDKFEGITEYNNTLASERIEHDRFQSLISIGIMIGVIIIAFIVSMILSNYISGIISKPMQKFAAFAELLAVGDIDVAKVTDEKDRLLYLRKDEVGILAGSFDKVIESTTEQAQITKAIADGDLTAVVTVRSEFDVLGKGLSDLVKKLHSLVSSIASSSEQVDSGAKLVSDSSVSLSQGASEQASSVEELTASLDEITSQTTKNAQNAQMTDNLAKDIKKDAEDGNIQMSELLSAMNEINASSDSINKIIKVIEDIAFQTNILALNAAVEAARAGQHGLGFAVVAEEVRNLAAQSAEAAKETTGLIENSIKKIKAGTEIADKTADSLGKIVSGISKATDFVDSIALASNEQATALEQINQGVAQISQVVQNTAAASEESAAASEELSGQADSLQKSITFFKLNKESVLSEGDIQIKESENINSDGQKSENAAV